MSKEAQVQDTIQCQERTYRQSSSCSLPMIRWLKALSHSSLKRIAWVTQHHSTHQVCQVGMQT